VRSNCLLLSALVSLTLALGPLCIARAEEEPGPELVQLVVNLLGENDKDLRSVGLEQVRSDAKGQGATRQFAALLPKLPPDAQAGLLSALADRGDVAARPAVEELLAASHDEPVRVAAIAALGFLGEQADLRFLLPLLSADSKAEKSAARAALVRLRGEGVPPAIAALLKQPPTAVRVALIEILASRRALDTIADLLAAAVDTEPLVRAAAMSALGQMAGSEHIPGMLQGVLKAEKGHEREAAERAVMTVCGRTADAEKRADPLLSALNTLDAADRMALLPTLGRIGGPAALTVVEAAIADPDPRLHEMGLRALCNWPDAAVGSRLIELANADQHPGHRAMTLAALIRVAPLPDKRTARERLELLQTAMGMCSREEEQNLVLKRAAAIRTVETLRYLLPYLEQPQFAQQACESVVELAHHRELRDANKAEFEKALDKVIQTSKDATVIERANRYKRGQTWAKPTAPAQN
jgi:HEAT repeat protein